MIPSLSRLASLAAIVFCCFGPAAMAGELVEVTIVEPYVDLHTGPGRGFPITHVVERGESTQVLKRRTDWIKVRSERGNTGWAHRDTLSLTLDSGGGDSQETPSVLDRVITPDMERRVITEDILDLEDFEVSLYGGQLSIEDFGSNNVAGIRLAYHATEDAFWEVSYAKSRLRTTNVALTDGERQLRYYNISLGYNLFPGEVFIGRQWAFNSAIYLIAGVGSTHLAKEEHLTFNAGAGWRFFLTDWIALHAHMRQTIFTHDVFGRDHTTQNLEASLGFAVFF